MAKKSAKIALIEDEKDLAEIYNIKLKMDGWQTVVINDALLAINILRKEKPTLVLLDVMMPDMDGYELFALIRKDKSLNSVKVYIWSNLTQNKDLERAKKLKVDGYLFKSDYTPAALSAKIKEILKK